MTSFEQGITGNCYYDHNYRYRQLGCAMIEQAIANALGVGLSDIKVGKYRRKCQQDAVDYIVSDEFQYDMDLLGLGDEVEKVRGWVTGQMQQYLFGDVSAAKELLRATA